MEEKTTHNYLLHCDNDFDKQYIKLVDNLIDVKTFYVISGERGLTFVMLTEEIESSDAVFAQLLPVVVIKGDVEKYKSRLLSGRDAACFKLDEVDVNGTLYTVFYGDTRQVTR